MLRDYQVVSPSLEGVLSNEVLSYEGIQRPVDILRILDGPASKGNRSSSANSSNNALVENKSEQSLILERYFHDLQGVFLKKFSNFVIEFDSQPESEVALTAMLQELIKIKAIMSRRA